MQSRQPQHFPSYIGEGDLHALGKTVPSASGDLHCPVAGLKYHPNSDMAVGNFCWGKSHISRINVFVNIILPVIFLRLGGSRLASGVYRMLTGNHDSRTRKSSKHFVVTVACMIFDNEVCGDTFLRNVGSHTDYTALSRIR
jgi:hypothetical protein